MVGTVPADVPAAPGGAWSSLALTARAALLPVGGVTSWDGGACEVLLGLQNPSRIPHLCEGATGTRCPLRPSAEHVLGEA